MFTTAGVTPRRSNGRQTRVVSVRPKKLTSMIARSRSGPTSAKWPVAPMPALFTSTSRPPKCRVAASTIRRRSSAEVTSASTVSSIPPVVLTSRASSASRAAERAAANTFMPRPAAATASARPMP